MNLFVLDAEFDLLPNGIIFRGVIEQKNATFGLTISQTTTFCQYFLSEFAYRSVLILNLVVVYVEF